jgi:hypothetical protein
MSVARMRWSSGGIVAVPLLCAAAACGGEDTGRPTEVAQRELPPDPGSAEVPCDQDADFEVTLLEDFEFGVAAGGWYTNNDTCEECQTIHDQISQVNRDITRLGGPAAHDPDPPMLGGELGELGELPGRINGLEQDLRRLEDEEEPDQEAIEAKQDEIDEAIEELEEKQAQLEDALELKPELEQNWNLCLYGRASGPVDASGDPAPPLRTSCLGIQETPPWTPRPVAGTSIPDGRCGSRYAMRLRGGPYTEWGGTFGISFSPPRDATEYEGIGFWARRSPHSKSTLRVEFSEQFTEQNYVDSETGQPSCDPDFLQENQRVGCDKFGVYAIFGPDWKFHYFPFSEFRQSGFGRRAPFFDIEGLLSLAFTYSRGQWDLWIDDIGFYVRR